MKILQKHTPISLRLPDTLHAQLNRLAKKLNTTKAELIRHLLKEGVLKL
jgi:predicted DNA-binding protein